MTEITTKNVRQFMLDQCTYILGPDGGTYTEEPVSVYMAAAERIEQLEMALEQADNLAKECNRISLVVCQSIDEKGLGDSIGVATSNSFMKRLKDYLDIRHYI